MRIELEVMFEVEVLWEECCHHPVLVDWILMEVQCRIREDPFVVEGEREICPHGC